MIRLLESKIDPNDVGELVSNIVNVTFSSPEEAYKYEREGILKVLSTPRDNGFGYECDVEYIPTHSPNPKVKAEEPKVDKKAKKKVDKSKLELLDELLNREAKIKYELNTELYLVKSKHEYKFQGSVDGRDADVYGMDRVVTYRNQHKQDGAVLFSLPHAIRILNKHRDLRVISYHDPSYNEGKGFNYAKLVKFEFNLREELEDVQESIKELKNSMKV